MKKYLGEEAANLIETPFVNYTAADWAMYFIEHYGQYDGSHHKQWVLDQVARILKGTPVIVKKAKWDNGYYEFRVSTGEPSREYKEWVILMKGGNSIEVCDCDEDDCGCNEDCEDCDEDAEIYHYDKGIAP